MSKLRCWDFTTSWTAKSLRINGKDFSTIEHHGETEARYHHRSHLFNNAMAFDIDRKIHQHWIHYIQQHGFENERCILVNDIDDPIDEAEKSQTLRSPILLPQREIDTPSLTHQPFRSWCQVCQQAKDRGGQHRRQHQEEKINIIQLDYTFMQDPHQAPQRSGRQQTFTILTAIETLPLDYVQQHLHQTRVTLHIKLHNYIVRL